AAAVFGPIAFATLHSVYAQFYGSFGISPEDVGINSGRVLTTSLVAFGFAFCIWVSTWLITFAIATAALTLIVPTDDDGAPSSGKPLVYRALGGALLIYDGITYAIGISSTKGLEGSSVRTVRNWKQTVPSLIPASALLSVHV